MYDFKYFSYEIGLRYHIYETVYDIIDSNVTTLHIWNHIHMISYTVLYTHETYFEIIYDIIGYQLSKWLLQLCDAKCHFNGWMCTKTLKFSKRVLKFNFISEGRLLKSQN